MAPKRGKLWCGAMALGAAILCCGVQADGKANASGARALGDASAGANSAADGDWPGYGRDADEQHFAPLTQINASNVGRLGLVSAIDLNVEKVQTQPIAVGGVVYIAAGLSVVQAIDPVAGRVLWRYDPAVGQVAGRKLRFAWGLRGLAYANGRLFVGTQDGRLIALSARNGKPIWSVQTTEGDKDNRYITGAPRVFNDKVIIGHGGADFGQVRGYVTCYSAKTGQQLWRFYTVPGDPAKGFEDPIQAMAAKTWTGERWKAGGGGTVWNAITYDPAFNRVYLGTGNGSPWSWRVRNPGGGDALFLASIVALDADTGKYVWHYQENPNEGWDYNSAMDIELADLTVDGRLRKVLLHAPKNGFFYVIDRQTGKVLSAEKLGKVTWADHIDLSTGRPVENPNIRYANSTIDIQPSSNGLHSWSPMAFDPKNRLVFIPTLEDRAKMGDDGVDPKSWTGVPNQLTTGLSTRLGENYERGSLLAWDPVLQRKVWSVTTAGYWSGGVMATGGNLVFQGELNGQFSAYESTTGRKLWTYYVGGAALSPPISYTVRSVQYVSVIAAPPVRVYWGNETFGWTYRNTPRRLLTFRLDAKRSLPPTPPPAMEEPLPDASFVVDPTLAKAGAPIYALRCTSCHGFDAQGFGGAPDLRASPMPLDQAAFKAVLRDGVLAVNGMPPFAELRDDELEKLRHFIRLRASKNVAQDHSRTRPQNGN